MIPLWFLLALAIVAIVSGVLELIGMALLDDEVSLLLMLIGVMAAMGAVTGVTVAMIGAADGVVLSGKAFAIAGLIGMAASAIGEMTVIIIRGFPEMRGNRIKNASESPRVPPRRGNGFPNAGGRATTIRPIQSEEHVIEQSFNKRSNRNRIAYISLFLALAEELIKAFLQHTPIGWAIVAAVLLILSFLSQSILDYRGERELYGTSYREAKETVSLIFESRKHVSIKQNLVFTQMEINKCLQTKSGADNKPDKADKATKLWGRILDMLLLYNPQKTGLGVLLGVVLHTVFENVMRFTELGDMFPGLALPIYFWMALGVLTLNFRNPFAYSPRRTPLDVVLGVLFGVVLHTVSENVMRFTELDLALPFYFWIAFGILALNFRNPFAKRAIDKELETQMRYIKKAQKNGNFTESEKRQQWRNFIALVNQKAS